MDADDRKVISQLGVYRVVDPKASRLLLGAKRVTVLAFNDVAVQVRRDDGGVCAIGMWTAGIALELIESDCGTADEPRDFEESSGRLRCKISKKRMDATKMAEDFSLNGEDHSWW